MADHGSSGRPEHNASGLPIELKILLSIIGLGVLAVIVRVIGIF